MSAESPVRTPVPQRTVLVSQPVHDDLSALQEDYRAELGRAVSKGPSDITALKPIQPVSVGAWVELLFVQAKETGLIPPAERRTLIELAARFGATALWARWGNWFQRPAP